MSSMAMGNDTGRATRPGLEPHVPRPARRRLVLDPRVEDPNAPDAAAPLVYSALVLAALGILFLLTS